MSRDLLYEEQNIAFDCQNLEEDSGGIKCKNYEVCETVLPKWWFDCKGQYLCTNCDMIFGELDIYDNIECPICLDVKRSISQPNCEHTLCIECFKRCYYGDSDTTNEPLFPYPDIENEYDEDMDNPKWNNEYPLIKKYNEEWNKWDDAQEAKYLEETNLQQCPLCRK